MFTTYFIVDLRRRFFYNTEKNVLVNCQSENAPKNIFSKYCNISVV
jgi:hypothetical protein